MANPATLPCPSRTLAILSVAHKAAVARLLFAEVVGRLPFPGLAKARMELRAQPSLFDELKKGGLGHETAVFKDWRVSARNPILLRLSGAFADVLKLSRGYRGRTLRLRATKVDFGDLEQSLMLIKQDAQLLSTPSENARSTALELTHEARSLFAQVERPLPRARRSKPRSILQHAAAVGRRGGPEPLRCAQAFLRAHFFGRSRATSAAMECRQMGCGATAPILVVHRPEPANARRAD